MGELLERVRRAVHEERYLFSDHADNQLRDRGIMHWQIVQGVEEGRLLRERPHARPNPAVEIDQLLPDGEAVKAVWAHVRAIDFAKLVTVHFYD